MPGVPARAAISSRCRATESTCLLGLLGTAMPWRTIAVVPVRSCPELQEVDIALIERVRAGQSMVVVVVVAVPVAGLMPIAEQLYNRLGADELALAEESAAGLVMQRLPRPSGRERRVDGPCLPREVGGASACSLCSSSS